MPKNVSSTAKRYPKRGRRDKKWHVYGALDGRSRVKPGMRGTGPRRWRWPIKSAMTTVKIGMKVGPSTGRVVFVLGRGKNRVPSTRKALFVLGNLSTGAAHTWYVQYGPMEKRAPPPRERGSAATDSVCCPLKWKGWETEGTAAGVCDIRLLRNNPCTGSIKGPMQGLPVAHFRQRKKEVTEFGPGT